MNYSHYAKESSGLYSLYSSKSRTNLEDSAQRNSNNLYIKISHEALEADRINSNIFYNVANEVESGFSADNACIVQKEHEPDHSGRGTASCSSSQSSNSAFKLRGESFEIWRNVSDLNRFLHSVYLYYAGRGYRVILLSKIANMVSFAFVFSCLLLSFVCVDWKTLLDFSSNAHRFSDLISFEKMLEMHWYFVLSCAIGGSIWIGQWIKFYTSLPELRLMKKFYEDELEISACDLPSTSLNTVFEKVRNLQQKVQLSPDALTCEDIACRTLKRENYIIAFFNHFPDVFDTKLTLAGIFNMRIPLTETLEWIFLFGVFEFIFDESRKVRKKFLKSYYRHQLAKELVSRLRIIASLYCLFLPLLVVYQIFYYVLKYGESYYSTPGTAGHRIYTAVARWKFREYNELEVFFNNRLDQSIPHAQRYISQMNNYELDIIGKFIAFFFGAVFTIYGVVSISSALLMMRGGIEPIGKMWVFSVLGILVAVGRSLMKCQQESQTSCDEIFNELFKCLHFLPNHWIGKIHLNSTKKEFSQLFQLKFVTLAQEVMVLFFIPLFLVRFAKNYAFQIVDFVRDTSVYAPGIGYVCRFSLFIKESSNTDAYAADVDHTKIEKSFINFKINFPAATGDKNVTPSFVERLQKFEATKNAEAPRTGMERSLVASINGGASHIAAGVDALSHKSAVIPISSPEQFLGGKNVDSAYKVTHGGDRKHLNALFILLQEFYQSNLCFDRKTGK